MLVTVWWTAAAGWTWYALIGAGVSAVALSLVMPGTRQPAIAR